MSLFFQIKCIFHQTFTSHNYNNFSMSNVASSNQITDKLYKLDKYTLFIIDCVILLYFLTQMLKHYTYSVSVPQTIQLFSCKTILALAFPLSYYGNNVKYNNVYSIKCEIYLVWLCNTHELCA